MTKQPIRVIIADDHSLMRLGFKALIATEKSIEIVGEAEDGHEAVALAEQLLPQVVVMDLKMPLLSGAEATKVIRKKFPFINILILTSFADSADMSIALQNGAIGALMKDVSDDILIKAIHAVADGRTFIQRDVQRLIEEDIPPEPLTKRQLDILSSVTRGLSNKDIAKQFEISEPCVKKHLISVFAKLGVATRAEAVALALRKHLLKM